MGFVISEKILVVETENKLLERGNNVGENWEVH